MGGDLLAQPGGVDQLAHKAATRQGLHGPLHQRLPPHLQQWLGGDIGQRAHALAAASGQHHGLSPKAAGEFFKNSGHVRMLPRPSGYVPGGKVSYSTKQAAGR